jgi:DNA-binding winged helix-turn-helix (wHTH) protein/Tol biopolymer transport system component
MPDDFRIGSWLVEPSLNSVTCDGKVHRLEPKMMEVLVYLAQNQRVVVSKEQLMRVVWPDTFVTDDVLIRCISELRRALEDDPKEPSLIETIPKRGYRLLQSVEPIKGRHRKWPLRAIYGTVAALTVTALVAVAYWMARRVVQSETLSVSRLTMSGRVDHAAISPDGKYLVYSEDNGSEQSLWLRQLVTASSIQLQPAASVSYSSLSFSRDGSFVYYTRSALGGTPQLHRLPVVGGISQKLLTNVPGKFSISPDGGYVAYVRRDEEHGDTTLVVAALDGSGERNVATRHDPLLFNPEEGASWSPDGELLAVVEVETKPVLRCSLLVLAAKDGSKRMSTNAHGHMLQPQWLADGSGLIAPIEEPYLQLWEFSYPQAQGRRINHDPMRYREVSLSSDLRSLVAVQADLPSNVWVGPADDPDRVRPVTSPGHFVGNFGLTWTLDGDIIFWTNANGTYDFVKMHSDGSDQKILPLGSEHKWSPEACPDGHTFLYVGLYSGVATLLRSDLYGSKPEPIIERVSGPRCSVDGKWVVYVAPDNELLHERLWKVPVNGGTAIQLTDKLCDNPSISHRGEWIACRYWPKQEGPPQLVILPFDGGPLKKIFDLPAKPEPRLFALNWAPDDHALVFSDDANFIGNLWLQPLSGGSPHPLTHFASGEILELAWSRDGKQIAIARGNNTSDAVRITNFR